MCYEGELLFCHRIRREFTPMNLEERQMFVQALRTGAHRLSIYVNFAVVTKMERNDHSKSPEHRGMEKQ